MVPTTRSAGRAAGASDTAAPAIPGSQDGDQGGGGQGPASPDRTPWYYELDPEAADEEAEDDDEGDDDDEGPADDLHGHLHSDLHAGPFQDDGDDDDEMEEEDDDLFMPGDEDPFDLEDLYGPDVDQYIDVDEDDVAASLFALASNYPPQDFHNHGMDDDDDNVEDEEENVFTIRNGDLEYRVVFELGHGQHHHHHQGSRGLSRFLRAARAGSWTRRDIEIFLQQPDIDDIMERLDGPGWQEFIVQEFDRRVRRLQAKDPNRFPKVPSEEGTKLMYSGAFGANDHDRHPKRHIARRLLERELGLGSWQERKLNNNLITQSLIPTSSADQIIHYEKPVYSGQFSDDGRFFYACCQDFKIRMYDTSNPYNWKHYKTVSYPWGQWTLTDATLSPDNKWIAYSSHSSLVSIAPTDPKDEGDPYSLDLSDMPGMHSAPYGLSQGFSGIFSVRFSGNGRELVAGTNRDSVVVYDIESRTVLHNVRGHDDDVNAVCFADKMSPHIIYSGSDDATIKVWDRRSMGDQREVGAFVGHIEGLTYIDSKGDGRYVLSNGKDQSMKLWDIRMAMTTDRFRDLQPMNHTPRRRRFDYRTNRYDEDHWDPHPDDNSVVTFRGHKVLYTLIRCHFSPPSSTNSRYVYSGSQDGKVHIWNMDATKAGEINVKEATFGTRPRIPRARFYFDGDDNWSTCVRDASWHPNAPFIAASSLNGFGMSNGTVSLHSYGETYDDDGEPPMPRLMTENLQEPTWLNPAVGGYHESSDESSSEEEL